MRTKIQNEATVTLQGTAQEMRDLFDELHSWTPSGGWSSNAQQFFAELALAGGLQ